MKRIDVVKKPWYVDPRNGYLFAQRGEEPDNKDVLLGEISDDCALKYILRLHNEERANKNEEAYSAMRKGFHKFIRQIQRG